MKCAKKLANIVTSVPPIIIHYINESELDMGTGPIYNLHMRDICSNNIHSTSNVHLDKNFSLLQKKNIVKMLK